MLALSALLLVVAALTLLIGGLWRDDLVFLWVSIAASVLGLVTLGVGVARARPRRRAGTGESAAGATWSGAASGDRAASPDDDELRPPEG